MADTLFKLIFDIAGDSTGGQKATRDLANSFGIEMKQIGSIVNTTLGQIENRAAYSYGYLGLGARGVARSVLTAVRDAGEGVKAVDVDTQKLLSTFDKLSKQTGFSVDNLRILARAFNALENDSTKVRLGLNAFGSDGLKLIPQMEALGASLVKVDQASAAVGSTAGSTALSLGIVAGAAVALVAAALALVFVLYQVEKGLFAATRAGAAYGEEIYRAQLRTKLSAETLSGLKLVADENARSFETLVAGLSRYLKNIEDAAKGNQSFRDDFAALGIDVEKSAKDPAGAINELVVAIGRLGGSAEENDALIKLLGRSGEQMIPVFRQLAGNIDQATGKAKLFGTALSEDDARAAHIFTVELADLRAQILGVSIAIFREMGPAFIQMIQASGSLLRALKPVFDLLGAGKFIIEAAAGALRGLAVAAAIATQNYAALAQQIIEVNNARQLAPIDVQGPTPTPLINRELEQFKEQIKAADLVGHEVRRQEAATTADLKLQLTERSISFAQYIAGRKAAAKIAYDDEVTAINNALEAVRNAKQLESEDYEEFSTRIALQQERLTSRLTLLNDEYRQKIAQADTDAKQEELERERAHRERLLNINIQEGTRLIAEKQEQIRLGTLTEAQGADQIARIELDTLRRRQTFFEEERRLAGENRAEAQRAADEIVRIKRELIAKEAEVSRQRTAAREREIQAALVLDRLELEKRSVDTNAFIIKQRDLAERGVTTFQAAEREIFLRQQTLLQFEISILDRAMGAFIALGNQKTAEQMAGQIEILKAQMEAFKAEAGRTLGFPSGLAPGRAGTADIEDITRRQQQESTLEEFYVRMQEITRAGEQAIIDELQRGAGTREEIINRETNVRLQELETRYRQEAAALLRRHELLSVDEDARKKNAKEIEAINQLLTAIGLQFLNDAIRIGIEQRRALRALDPTSDERLFGEQYAAQLRKIKKEMEDLGKSVDSVVIKIKAFGRALAESLRRTVEELPTLMQLTKQFIDDTIQGLAAVARNWVLYGETGPAAIRKVLAEALAALAQQALVNALYYTAQGIVDIFFNPARAAADFKAAGIWFGIAAGAGLAGRGVAGTLFSQPAGGGGSSGGGGRGGGSSGNEREGPTIINTGRNQIIEHIWTIRLEPGLVKKEIVRTLESNNPQVNAAVQNVGGRRR